MAEIILTKHILIVDEENEVPDMDLGVIRITAEGIEWYLNKIPILRMTWEQWALGQFYTHAPNMPSPWVGG